MINPSEITNYNRTKRELQIFWLFCIMVAGKNSDRTAEKLNNLIKEIPEDAIVFSFLGLIDVRSLLVKYKIGQYNRITRAILQSILLNIETATLEDLQKIHGVGPKTARFFILHSRRDARVAVLDTHILKWLKKYGINNVPDSTPSLKKYLELEKIFLDICDKQYKGKTIADIDLSIWNEMRN